MIALLVLLISFVFFGLGTGTGTSTYSYAGPPAKLTPISVRVGDQHAPAIEPNGGEAMTLTAAPGDALDVSVSGRHDPARELDLAAKPCGKRIAAAMLPPGAASWRLPRVVDGAYRLTIHAGGVEGVVDVVVIGAPGESSPACG